MKILNGIKENLPLILVLGIVPYFFYSQPNLGQSIIAVSLAALAGFKYYLDFKELPNYEKVFKERLDKEAAIADENFKNVAEELLKINQKLGKIGVVEAQKGRLSSVESHW